MIKVSVPPIDPMSINPLQYGELTTKRIKVPDDFSFMQLKVELYYDP